MNLPWLRKYEFNIPFIARISLKNSNNHRMRDDEHLKQIVHIKYNPWLMSEIGAS